LFGNQAVPDVYIQTPNLGIFSQLRRYFADFFKNFLDFSKKTGAYRT